MNTRHNPVERVRSRFKAAARAGVQRLADVALRQAHADQVGRDEAIAAQLQDLHSLVLASQRPAAADASVGFGVERLQRSIDEMQRTIGGIAQATEGIDGDLERLREIAASVFDDIPTLRRQLAEIRASSEYASAFDEREPLVTVRIATYNLAEMLLDRAIASVRAQTYDRLEVIVVGDACTDDTGRRIAALNDERIRFINLSYQGPYPDPPQRWLVAGSPGMNLGAALASGRWIAPLDDDDEFLHDHIEVLVEHARSQHVEVAYGNIVQKPASAAESEVVLSSFPPRFGQFGFQAAVYHHMLSCFEYNTKSWLLDEPGDWNLARRMMEAGVTFGWIDRAVSMYYPSTLHRPRRDPH